MMMNYLYVQTNQYNCNKENAYKNTLKIIKKNIN